MAMDPVAPIARFVHRLSLTFSPATPLNDRIFLFVCGRMSTLGGIKPPSHRDAIFKSGQSWLQCKVVDDAIGDPLLWRVGNKLYDLSSFQHPGGADWINNTRGQDITELFHVHHVDISRARALLKKYYVRDTNSPRNSPYTFKEGDFYDTLRGRIFQTLKQRGGHSGTTLAMLTIQFSLLALTSFLVALSLIYDDLRVMVLAGLALTHTIICAHNFFHKKDNFIMYIFDLSLLSSWEWRISHCISHHIFTNTLLDVEISALEPFLMFLPSNKKSFLQRHMVLVYSWILYLFIFFIQFVQRNIGHLTGNHPCRFESSFPLLEYILFLVAGYSPGRALQMWCTLHMTSSFWFAFVGLVAAHHSPDCWHDGDAPPSTSRDFGVCTLDAVRDRKEVQGNLFLVAISFGDHGLHHLFPTVDHSKLPYLHEVFWKTVDEFKLRWEVKDQLHMLKGKYAQLARTSTMTTKLD